MLFPLREKHEAFMGLALILAQKASIQGEVPVGAIIIDAAGSVIAETSNQVERRATQTAHAELLAIADAGRVIGDWRLSGCTIYVSLAPCAMCMHALWLSRITMIVFGADSPLFGAHIDNVRHFQVYKSDPPLIIGGVCKDQSEQLLRTFFQTKRNRVSVAKEQNLELVKEQLQERRRMLEEELKKLSQEKVTDDQVQDPGDQALASTMETLKSSFQSSTRDEYECILQAIAKIEEGTYGICVDCNQKISPRRLTSNPNASRCLACQEAYEEHAY